jgi:hypothetical protein
VDSIHAGGIIRSYFFGVEKMKKIGLNILERSTIVELLPGEGNIITLRLKRDLVSKVGFSAEDFERFEIKSTPDETDPTKSWTSWNAAGNTPIEIGFEDAEIELVKKKLAELNSAGKLTDKMISLYEKFGVN